MNFQDWVLTHGRNIQLAGFYGTGAAFVLWETLKPFCWKPLDRKHRWSANYLLTITSFILVGTISLNAMGVSLWASQHGFGLINRVAMPAVSALAITMVARSLAAWLYHYLMHQVPAFWCIHRVHHLDTAMDVSTTIRFHPVEMLGSHLIVVLTTALVGAPAWALFIYEPLEGTLRWFSHANIRLPGRLDWVLRFVVSTPEMHRLHHFTDRREAFSNYGTIFSFWDHIFGTYVSPEGKDLAGMPLGTEGFQKAKVQSFFWLLVSPLERPAHQPDAASE